MNDLLLDDATHDLTISNGDFQLLNNEAKVAKQTLKINLLHCKGEWFLDNTYGVPYFQEILGKVGSTKLPDAILINKIRESYNISSINSFESSLSSDRTYTIDSMTATTEDGEVISLTNTAL